MSSFPRLRFFYRELRGEAGLRFKKIFDVPLQIDEAAGKGPRSFAWCESGPNGVSISVASKLERQSDERIEGVLRHEIGHALDFLYGVDELERRFGRRLPTKAERRADEIALEVWGQPIRYDGDDVQTIGEGRVPRPGYLPR